MGFDGHLNHHKLVITTNFESSPENTISESSNDFNLETTSGRMYESCIGSGCSRSPSPIRREFWESNKPLPEIVLKRKELALRNRLQAGEGSDEQRIAGEGTAVVGVRQGRPRFRINQSRDPLFVYNDASENVNGSGLFGNSIGASQIPRDHTPSPRRPRTSLEVANCGNLTLDVDVTGDDDEGYRDGNVNNSSTNSPRSVKFIVNSSPQEVDNDCGSLCCPSARSFSPSSPNSLCQFVDRGSSPVSIRSRSPNPGVRRSPRQNQGRVEVHNEERSVEVDEDDDGNLHIQISASGDNSPASPMYTPCPSPCCRKRSRSPSPTGLSVTPTSACRTPPFRGGRSHNSVEISSDDGDVQIAWEGSGVNLEVDLENSDDCSTPRRVNVRCSRSPPPKFRSTSLSRSPSPGTPRLRSPKSHSPTAARSPDPSPRHSKPFRLEPRPAWDNTSVSSGRGALRLDRPPPIVYRSRSPSKSRSICATPNSRTPSPRSRITRKIEIRHRLEEESPRPSVEVDYDYFSESIDSQSTSSCTPQRNVCRNPFKSWCSTPCRSRCSTASKSRPTSSGSRSRSPQGVEIRSATSDVPLVTIHQDYLSANEGSARSKSEPLNYTSSRSEPPNSTSSRSSPRVTVRKSRSRSATPPWSKAIINCVSNSMCRAASPCEPVSSCCNCCSSCSCCRGNSGIPCCHGRHHPPSPCNCSHQLQGCHTPCSPNSSRSCCLSCRPPSASCRRACHSSCHRTQRCETEPEPYCARFCPAPGDIIIRACQRQPCPHSGKDDGQVGFFCHRSACGLREGDTLVRLGRFDPTGKWCASDVVGMYMLGSQGLWIFLGDEEGHECLRPVQADHHQIVRTVNRWFRPRLGDLIIHTLPGPHSFYFWNPRKRLDCHDTRLLLRAYIGIPQIIDEHHNLSCCSTSHLPVGYAELYVNVRNQWLFLGRDDHMFTECEITSSS